MVTITIRRDSTRIRLQFECRSDRSSQLGVISHRIDVKLQSWRMRYLKMLIPAKFIYLLIYLLRHMAAEHIYMKNYTNTQ